MNRVGLGLAVGAGYVLGRTKKMKMAFALGTLVAGKRMHLSPRAVADLVSQQLQNNPQFKEIGDQLREDLRGVGKAASGAMVERQIEALADRLHGRTAEVRDTLSGAAGKAGGAAKKARGAAGKATGLELDEQDESPEPEDTEEEPREEYEDEEPEDREPEDEEHDGGEPEAEEEPPARKTAKKAAKKAPAKKTAAKRAPAKKAPAKKTASKQTPAKKSAAKKTAGRKTAAARSGARSTRARVPKGGGE
ncbi:hypothetical protein [Streptomyces sp. HGB0020]|uniref:hypothetical protein n=1 Tax=Streptomyces sp. HGB0020 TaxID=1078086 RepID=UPI00034E986F|nr:hypothetical protein [Streptomyces sp. HGB0020]EPD67478.1 hypothetical protein HMPREF1211_01737 [Streptomyces sp. HGB0020]